MKILGFIPARGGSKGIKNKNIVDVGGKPLLAYTCEPALRALHEGVIDRLIVSTDSPEIAGAARQCGVEVPFLRPDALSGDSAKSYEAVLHAVDFFAAQGEIFDAVLILQPTSPLRRYEDITVPVGMFRSGQCTSLVSCYREEAVHPKKMYYVVDGKTVPVDADHNAGARRQDYNSVFVRNGAIYIVQTNYVRDEKKCYSDAPAIYEMPRELSIDIDRMDDLTAVRQYLGYNFASKG